MTTFEILKIIFYFSHVGVDVAAWYETFRALYQFFAVIKPVKEYRQVCFQGYVVKTFLPFGVERTCAFRCYAEAEACLRCRRFGKLVGHSFVFGAVYGYAANFPEHKSERPEEPLFFHQEVDVHPFSPHIQLAYQEVDVACVWSKADYEFVRVFLGHVFHPAHPFIQ